jgi:DNA-binding NarL/FixJ family response regulator
VNMPTQTKQPLPSPISRKSILLVDDHSIFRTGLSTILRDQRDLQVGGEAEDYATGLKAIRAQVFDLVIVDIGLGFTADGLELIKTIKAEQPDLHILIVSVRDESVYASRSLRAGAAGYLMKGDTTTDSLLKALRHVFAGEIYLSQAMQQRVLANHIHGSSETGVAVDLLSDRELEILHLVGHGVDVKQIAAKLNLSPKTVQTYRDRIRQKLVFANARELARFAHEWVESEEI